MNNFSTTSVKFLELAFIFIIIFSVVCKVANYEFVHSKILNKIYSFIINRLNNKDDEEELISYRNEMSLYGLNSNQVDIVISNNRSMSDISKMPCNHISNISPTNNFPMSTPNLKIDEHGNIIPNDTFLKSNPFLITNNTPKKTEKKENPIQFPTIIVTLPNEAILPYSPKIPMDIYYREGWVDYSNPDSCSQVNTYNPREISKRKVYDYNYLAPLIPKNHFSLKLQQSFITKFKIQENNNTNSNNTEVTKKDEKTCSDSNVESFVSIKENDKKEISNSLEEHQLIGSYYINECVNEYAEEYELVNHAFWWQSDCNQQAILV
jgi:hypothetical protein